MHDATGGLKGPPVRFKLTMHFADISKRCNLLLLAGCIALIQIACYYVVGATVRSDGGMAIAQPDTLLYCQAARRIAEGFPFSFSEGTAASTGTTSVAYPFVLAVPYMLGCKGGALLTAGFLLNAIFYLLFVVGWTSVACRAFVERPIARVLSVALVASFGPFAYCALAQSDIGLWMAVSAWLAYGLYVDSKRVYVPLLFLAPWVRPEGMIVAVVYCAFCGFDVLRRRRLSVESLVAVVAAISVVGVFALNYAISGAPQFSSVAHKGYFKNLSFIHAAYASAEDMMSILKAYVFGIPQRAPRDFFCVPVVGAALMWVGVFSRPWRDVSWRELVWYIAMLGGAATVATSGWQGTNIDRYLVWTMPVLLAYMAFGSEIFASKLGAGALRLLPGAVLVLFSGAMAIVFLCVFGVSASASDAVRAFAVRSDVEMPVGCSAGIWGNCGIAYEMSSRRIAHLSGIYSPEFLASKSIVGKFEILKNEPETRFDYWISKVTDKKFHYLDKPDEVAGPVVFAAPPGLELRKADWSAYDAGRAAPPPPTDGLSLVDLVDVAYERGESAAEYEQLTRDDYPLFAPFHAIGKLGEKTVFDAGRFLFGGDAMTVSLKPGQDVYVVMRTVLKCSVSLERCLGHLRSDFSFKSPMTLRVMVDGEIAGDIPFLVEEGDFCDAHFVIPGKFIKQPKARLAFLGEHVAFAYWFFQ